MSLYALEGAIVRRLRIVHSVDHNRGNALLEIMRHDGETMADILDTAEVERGYVTAPEAFRPTLRKPGTIVGRLWRIAQGIHPDGLGKPAKAVAAALAVDNDIAGWYESLNSVVRRPSSRETSAPLRFSRNLLVTVATTCQLITAAAHSDDYPSYPVVLLRSVSLDLRRSINDAETVIGSY
jgi:hypothetical protein